MSNLTSKLIAAQNNIIADISDGDYFFIRRLSNNIVIYNDDAQLDSNFVVITIAEFIEDKLIVIVQNENNENNNNKIMLSQSLISGGGILPDSPDITPKTLYLKDFEKEYPDKDNLGEKYAPRDKIVKVTAKIENNNFNWIFTPQTNFFYYRIKETNIELFIDRLRSTTELYNTAIGSSVIPDGYSDDDLTITGSREYGNDEILMLGFSQKNINDSTNVRNLNGIPFRKYYVIVENLRLTPQQVNHGDLSLNNTQDISPGQFLYYEITWNGIEIKTNLLSVGSNNEFPIDWSQNGKCFGDFGIQIYMDFTVNFPEFYDFANNTKFLGFVMYLEGPNQIYRRWNNLGDEQKKLLFATTDINKFNGMVGTNLNKIVEQLSGLVGSISVVNGTDNQLATFDGIIAPNDQNGQNYIFFEWNQTFSYFKMTKTGDMHTATKCLNKIPDIYIKNFVC
jgi:hypothetical protein